MPTYKGNAGNLMQHWTLCELVHIADEQNAPGLNFIDAHAMAPWATECPKPDPTFVRVRQDLPNGQSVYENAWCQLATAAAAQELEEGYPNSANFVQHICNLWNPPFSLLLCETNRRTVAELDPWLRAIDRTIRCEHTELCRLSWRTRFRRGLPGPRQVGLCPDESLTLMSFDPYKYERNRRYNDPYRQSPGKSGHLYRDDVQRTLTALENVKGGIVIQLSTYSTSNHNPQNAVVASVDRILRQGRFTLAAKVVLNPEMMSLVYARDISWWAELADLPQRFDDWRPR